MIDQPVALITGASGDLGRAIALALSRNGAAIVGTGRSDSGLAKLRAALGPDAQVATIAQDVTANSAPRDAVAAAMDRFGRLDYLINNAGVGKPKPLHLTTDEDLDTFLAVHLRAAFRYCRESLGAFGSSASIVNVASTFAIIGGMNGGAYSTAKAGLIGLSTHIAAQYGARGVRANVVAPGVFRSAMTEYAWDSERFKRMNFEMTPAARPGTAEDVASLVAFLCSDAGSFINGQVIAVDGGWSATKYLSDESVGAVRVPPTR
jgi:meso-butanediol dehydrogenase / (S,S)-butanediol dehydrogenase / diacetyl reductase